MPPEGVVSIVRIGEDRAQAEAVEVLTERVLAGMIDWFKDLRDGGLAHSVLQWVKRDGTAGFDKLTDLPRAGRVPPGRAGAFGGLYGHMRGEFGRSKPLPDAAMFRRALVVVAIGDEAAMPSMVVVMRDTDGSRDVVAAWDQVIEHFSDRLPFEPRLAWFHQEAEAWYLAGARALDVDEELRSLRQELGFDPTGHPERCLAGREGSDGSPKNAKTVLRRLARDTDDERACLVGGSR